MVKYSSEDKLRSSLDDGEVTMGRGEVMDVFGVGVGVC